MSSEPIRLSDLDALHDELFRCLDALEDRIDNVLIANGVKLDARPQLMEASDEGIL
ncbi:MAG: hypothetical protein R3C10_26730 [Pirellulales bacterium]